MKARRPFPHQVYYLKQLLGTLLLALICQPALGQNPSAKSLPVEYRISDDPLKNKMNIDFEIVQPVYNLLVIVHDSTGKTIFLENRYRFTGKYQREVELINKGTFFLQIVRDEERFNKTVMIK
jgi:hypothetical protein